MAFHLCKHCLIPIERESDRWVDVRSGDDGGTYDICTAVASGSHAPKQMAELVEEATTFRHACPVCGHAGAWVEGYSGAVWQLRVHLLLAHDLDSRLALAE